jgi:hypothetical protein
MSCCRLQNPAKLPGQCEYILNSEITVEITVVPMLVFCLAHHFPAAMSKQDPNNKGDETPSVAEKPTPDTSGEDPYNRTIPPLDATARTRRRTLDDMRQLSATIKAGRVAK